MLAITQRDAQALRRLYDKYSPVVFALCIRILKDRADAEEVLEEVFFEIWERSDRYDAARGSPITYLMQLTRSRATDRWRNRARRNANLPSIPCDSTPETASGTASPDQSAQISEMRAGVLAALAELDAEQRQALELAYYDGLSHSEIAQKLGQPLGTVKTRIRRSLIHLRDSLRTFYNGPTS